MLCNCKEWRLGALARRAARGARGRGVRGDGARGREFLERQHIFGMCVCVCVCLCRHSLRGRGRADRQPDVRAPGPGAARMILCGPRAARCASCCVAISRMRCRLIASRSEREPSGSALMRRRSHNTCDAVLTTQPRVLVSARGRRCGRCEGIVVHAHARPSPRDQDTRGTTRSWASTGVCARR